MICSDCVHCMCCYVDYVCVVYKFIESSVTPNIFGVCSLVVVCCLFVGSLCMSTVSKASLVSCATVIVHAGGHLIQSHSYCVVDVM